MKTKTEILERITECKQALKDTAHVSNTYMPTVRKEVEAVICTLEWIIEDENNVNLEAAK